MNTQAKDARDRAVRMLIAGYDYDSVIVEALRLAGMGDALEPIPNYDETVIANDCDDPTI